MGDILSRGDCRRGDILYYRVLGDEMVNDLISREEVLKAMHRNEQYAKAFGYHSVFQTVLEVPAVKRKTGKWLPDSRYYDMRFVCSACKNTESVTTVNFKPVWKYCPNCGARMENSDE